jgi:polysaccharide biosynthesis/export protein
MNKPYFIQYPNIKNKIALCICSSLIFIFSSCKVTQQKSYFSTLTKDTTITGFVNSNQESKIINGDQLAITVSSLSPTEDAIFNGTMATGTEISGYTVDEQGQIQLHRLGNTKAAGLTRKELSKKIEQGLLPYTKEPIVKITYLNHKATIFGEVKAPQVLKMPEEQISLIDAIVLSGDITPLGKRNDIVIIREEGNTKTVKHINLEDHSIFTSPWYYIKPNDIVLIGSDYTKTIKEEKQQKLQTSLSLIATVVSLAVVVLSRFIN